MTQDAKKGAVLVAGSGIGGMQSAILLAEAGRKVYLLDSAPGIGGSLHLLDNTFPTDSCGICLMLPGRAAYCPSLECSMHDNVELLPYAEVSDVAGGPGDFTVKVNHKPRYVKADLCNNCGLCVEVCPESRPDPYEGNLAPQKAIYRPPSRAMPNTYLIDMDACTRCGKCVEVCPIDAIDLVMETTQSEIRVGAVILSPGFKPFDAALKKEYGFGYYPNVLTSLQYERMSSFSGSTGGRIVRPSDGAKPKKIAFISCVGSRDPSIGRNYCSSVCCMYTAKLLRVTKRIEPDIEMAVFYMDTRAVGKGYERYLNVAQNQPGVRYVRSMASYVREVPGTGNLRVQYALFEGMGDGDAPSDPLPITHPPIVHEEEFDMVVLAVGFDPADGASALANKFGVDLNDYRYTGTNPFEPALTNRPGIFVAGSFSEPKDIPETVIEAASAAAAAAGLLADLPGQPIQETEYPEERDVSDEETRIGVFVCDCEGEIGKTLDVPAVVEYARNLPNVVHADSALSASAPAGREKIKRAIAEHELNRIVVAGGAPRIHEAIFQGTLREVGLNANLLEMANLREQVAWVHSASGNGAVMDKAKDLVRMAAAKVSGAAPIRHTPAEVNHRALVLGGGIAGMTAALTFAQQGFDVVLVEREERLGGNLRHIYTGFYGSDPQQLLRDTIKQVQENQRITLLLEAELREFSGHVGAFHSRLKQADGSWYEAQHGATVIATGAGEIEPTEYGYGALPGVMTQREYEQLLGSGNWKLEVGNWKLEDDLARGSSNLQPPTSNLQSIVMIQCVGSRDEKRPYCSRICCAEAIKNAIETKKRNPQTQVSILYRDIRTYGFKEDLYREARALGVLFLEYDPEKKATVSQENGRLSVQLLIQPENEPVTLEADMVVLSAGIEPAPGNAALAQVLDLPLDEDGFFREANAKMRPLDFAHDGVYLCGLAHSPRTIDEAMAQARGAAMRAIATLVKEKLPIQPNIATVNPRLCSACGICVDVCPFGARVLPGENGYYAHVIDALCQGCGTCVAACPNNACQQEGYQARQMLGVIDAALALA